MAKLRHIAIIVPDPEQAATFFEQAFGMKRAGADAIEIGIPFSDPVAPAGAEVETVVIPAGRRARASSGVLVKLRLPLAGRTISFSAPGTL